MSFFNDDIPPEHIERVENETKSLFSHLRTEKTKMLEIFKGIRTPLPDDTRRAVFDTIDLGIAWAEFDALSYNAFFKETGGDMETLHDPMTRNRILSRIYSRWPLLYHIKLLHKHGIMDTLEFEGEQLYFFRKDYKESIKTVSTASSTLQG